MKTTFVSCLALSYLLFGCNTNEEKSPSEGEIVVDEDGDGYFSDDDCNDSDAAINPGAEEICDGIDNNCNHLADENATTTFHADSDGDGYGNVNIFTEACNLPEGYVEDGTDCDDTNSGIHPNATEECDGLDNDCNGEVDEDLQLVFYIDADGDGFGSEIESSDACQLQDGLSAISGDCDDNDPSINPYATEQCDEIDNDCNGQIDEGVSLISYPDQDEDGFGDSSQPVDSCETPEGYVSIGGDCDDLETYVNPMVIEFCDGTDNDCDGDIDEPGSIGEQSLFVDSDGDGYGDAASMVDDCPESGLVTNGLDCDDLDATISPAAQESCNESDDDCDGIIDENAIDAQTYYADDDEDGYGDPNEPIQACSLGPEMSVDATDCDDNDNDIHPLADEYCNGEDDDCDGSVDEQAVDESIWYADSDGDGFGDPTVSNSSCDQPLDHVGQGADCDDNDLNINPDATEVCDEIDNNCDGSIDNEAIDQQTWYLDSDGDGFGDEGFQIDACDAPTDHVADSGDCDDDDSTINPGETEIGFDGVDNDCDSTTVDSDTYLLLHMDGTSDNFYDSSGNNWTIVPTGGVQQSTAESVFGGSSIELDGSDDRLEITDGDWSLGGDDFTIDMWIWLGSVKDMGMITNESPITANDGWMFDIDMMGNSGAHGLTFHLHSSPIVQEGAGVGYSYPLQTWIHVAVVRSGDTFTLYRNGTAVASNTASVYLNDTTSNLRVGQRGTTADWFHGYIDEVRVIKGIALWDSDFTPPTAPTLGAGD